MHNIQILDDDPAILKALQRVLHAENWKIDTFSDPQAALHALTENDYAVIISDLHMPQLDGITYLQFAKQAQPHAIRLLLSGHGDRNSLTKAINHAAIYRFVSKPWDDYELISALSAGVELYALQAECRTLLAELKQQKLTIARQQHEWLELQKKHPELLKVKRDDDGHIILFDEL